MKMTPTNLIELMNHVFSVSCWFPKLGLYDNVVFPPTQVWSIQSYIPSRPDCTKSSLTSLWVLELSLLTSLRHCFHFSSGYIFFAMGVLIVGPSNWIFQLVFTAFYFEQCNTVSVRNCQPSGVWISFIVSGWYEEQIFIWEYSAITRFSRSSFLVSFT